MFCVNPDEIRGWAYDDFEKAINSYSKVPPLYLSFFNCFCKPSGKKSGLDLSDKSSRQRFLENLT